MPTDEPLSKSDRSKLESLGRSLLSPGPKPVPKNWIMRWSNMQRVADKRRRHLIHCDGEWDQGQEAEDRQVLRHQVQAHVLPLQPKGADS
ncbi:hypothetical protein SAY87_008439 [Trapa incisa]|uniref:Uncharacterized protein n=1 Tax=Trapa incisa TaxID=236973 RepID=A0AAN7KI64_9MYRT|nr:hypothetical protein SAY87_008439 [Trapa incisa]